MKSGNYVIIGASHGIGAEIFNKLDECSTVYSFSRTQGPGEWRIWDHTSALEVEHLPEVIDGIVYCPGTINLRPFHMLKEADFLKDLEVNYLGAVKVLQALYPRLKKSPHASVVLLSTVDYRLTKHQIMTFCPPSSKIVGKRRGMSETISHWWSWLYWLTCSQGTKNLRP